MVSIIGLNFSVVLMDFEPYTDCQTSIERQCTISATASVCETPALQYINVSTELLDVLTHQKLCNTHTHTHTQSDPVQDYTRDFRCLRMPGSSDLHIITTSIIVDEAINDVYRVCYRVRVEGVSSVQQVACGLQVTRCRSSRDVPVNIVTTSPASQANSQP